MTPPVLPLTAALQHLGSLHAYETALVLVIAFGPFVVIVGLVLRERRRAGGVAARDGDGDGDGDHGPGRDRPVGRGSAQRRG